MESVITTHSLQISNSVNSVTLVLPVISCSVEVQFDCLLCSAEAVHRNEHGWSLLLTPRLLLHV
jgi:hypothetical protein